MVSSKISKLLLLCLNGYAVSAQRSPEARSLIDEPDYYTKFCNDTHITYSFNNLPAEQSNVLRIRAGICTKNHLASSMNYNAETQRLLLSVPFRECELKMYDDRPVYERSSEVHYFSTTIEVTFGVQDQDIEVVFDTKGLAVQCSTLVEYEVAFDYTVKNPKCQNDEKTVNGICVFFGDQNVADFQLVEYTDDSFAQQATDANRETTSGRMIYLGILANHIPKDYTWAVESCWIVESTIQQRHDVDHADDHSESSHLFFDPAGTSGIKVDGLDKSCKRKSVDLSGRYNSENPQFRMKHLLFMLNGDDLNSVQFTLKCNIRLCCTGDDESALGRCSQDQENAVCRDSRDTCSVL